MTCWLARSQGGIVSNEDETLPRFDTRLGCRNQASGCVNNGMMDVYLVRHAIAEHRDPARWPDDAERPLAPKGIARFRSAARGLHRIVPAVEVVLASPYRRAWETAEILHDEIAWPAPERCPALEAIRSPAGALEVLLARKDRPSAALVGHEPYLSRLASLLLSGEEDLLRLELKKGGVALLAFADDPRVRDAFLRWSATPKILRSLDVEATAD